MSVKTRRAARQHICSCCGGVIYKGDTYEVHKGLVFDTDSEYFNPTVGKLCVICSEKGRKPYMSELDPIMID